MTITNPEIQRLKKDDQIKWIVSKLKERYSGKIMIKDFWEADLCAIGLCDTAEKYLIYLSTYGLPKQRINLIIENLDEGFEHTKTIDEYNNISLNRLEEILFDYLEIE